MKEKSLMNVEINLNILIMIMLNYYFFFAGEEVLDRHTDIQQRG